MAKAEPPSTTTRRSLLALTAAPLIFGGSIAPPAGLVAPPGKIWICVDEQLWRAFAAAAAALAAMGG